MPKYSKKYKNANSQVKGDTLYPLNEAVGIVKKIAFAKFDESVDVSVRLGIDPSKSNQIVRGVVALPNGTGKKVRILALVNSDKEKEAKESGADFFGMDEYIDKISKGWTDFDVVVTTPDLMPKIARLGKILGPRGLMPNPKTGTVTTNLEKSIKEVKAGKIEVKTDKAGNVHASVGKKSFKPEHLEENITELLHALQKMKPSVSKGVYFRNIVLSSTMGPAVPVDKRSISGIL